MIFSRIRARAERRRLDAKRRGDIARFDAEVTAINKAAADKLIPRFATWVKVTLLTDEQMRTPITSVILAHLYGNRTTKTVEFRQGTSTEGVTFTDLPPATYTHLLVNGRLVPLDGAPGGEGPM